MLSPEHIAALETLAKAQRWDKMSIEDLGVLLWALFHFYARRL
jgi:hypothetical protein